MKRCSRRGVRAKEKNIRGNPKRQKKEYGQRLRMERISLKMVRIKLL